MVESKQANNRYIAFASSFVIHLLLVLFLFFFMLRTPIPPFSGGQGVVLNLGFVDEGTGDVQTLNDPNDSQIKVENKPQENPEEITEPNSKQESNPESKAEENLVTSNEESTVQSEAKTETSDKPANETKQNTKVETNSTPEVKEKPKEINKKALFGQSGTATDGGNNNGDKVGKVGDQGNPDGDINAKALYGNPGTGGEGLGGSGGASLDMAGWKWAKIPKVNDEDEDEKGKIVFQVTIDDEGEIVDVKTIEKTVSSATERLYKQEVERLTFVKTDNKTPATRSVGRITFIIRSR
ncbi:MAG: hypothetical protein SFY32_08180 [Bacteroidota bacterium]|nr:hypothetical protein [Bacteroidota bacterium]